ncbi:MAG: YCF48-related protein [Balneolaceae bacterium]
MTAIRSRISSVLRKGLIGASLLPLFLWLFTGSLYAQDEWVVQDTPGSNELFSIHFHNSMLGWAAGAGGQILKTTDGGEIWDTRSSGASVRIEDISFVDANIGWAVGHSGLVLRSEDGGESWTQQQSNTDVNLLGISVIDADRAWLVGQQSVIRFTTDGGETWEVYELEVPETLFDVFFLDEQRGWIASVGVVFYTTDGGLNWQESGANWEGLDFWAEGDSPPALISVQFVNDTTGWASGASGSIIRTQDGGVSWEIQEHRRKYADPDQGFPEMRALHFTTPLNGRAVGFSGTILLTTDGGESWVPQVSGSTQALHDVSFPSARTGWVAGSNGTVLYTELLVSATESIVTADFVPTLLATGTDTALVTIELKDEELNAVDGFLAEDFTISFPGLEGVSAGPATETEIPGTYEVEVTSVSEGSVTVEVFAGGIELVDKPPLTFSDFTVDPASLASATTGHLATGTDTAVVTMDLTEVDKGLAVSGLDDSDFVVQLSDPVASVAGPVTESETPGSYKLPVVSTAAANVTVQLQVRGVGLSSEPVIEFFPYTVDGVLSEVTATSPHLVAPDDSAQVTISLVETTEGLPIAGFENFLITLSGSAVISDPVTEQEDPGIYTFWVTNSVTEDVSVVVNADAVELSDQPVIQFTEVPDPPVLNFPGVGAEHIEVMPEFTWQVPSGAQGFRFQLAPDNQFNVGELIFDVTLGPEGIFTPEVPLENDTDYWWRVASTAADTTSDWSDGGAGRMFRTIITVPDTVQTASPIEDSFVDAEGALFVWNGSQPEVDEYRIQVSADTSFSAPVVDTTQVGTTFTTDVLVVGTEYWWRAEALNIAGSSGWSEPVHFTAITMRPPHGLTLDVNQITGNLIVDLQWEVGEDQLPWLQSNNPYRVYRGVAPDELELLADRPNTSISDQNPPAQSNFYAVSLRYGTGEAMQEGPLSNAISLYSGTHAAADMWELVSLPLKEPITPGSEIRLYSYANTYTLESEMLPSAGYWVKSEDNLPREIEFLGAGLDSAAWSLQEGWNLIGALSAELPADSIQDPGGVLSAADLFGYEDGSYQPVTTLQPGRGYWIHADAVGEITLGLSMESAVAGASAVRTAADQGHPRLVVRQGNREQSIELPGEEFSPENRRRWFMPPLPPGMGLDLRTSEGLRALNPEEVTGLQLQSAEWPVTMELETSGSEAGGADPDLHLRITGNHEGREVQFDLRPGVPVELHYPITGMQAGPVGALHAVTETSLLPNFPNPFQSETTIVYQLHEQVRVSLELYDLLGRRVQTLVREEQPEGHYEVPLDGRVLSSGVYAVRFVAGNYTETRFITLIR